MRPGPVELGADVVISQHLRCKHHWYTEAVLAQVLCRETHAAAGPCPQSTMLTMKDSCVRSQARQHNSSAGSIFSQGRQDLWQAGTSCTGRQGSMLQPAAPTVCQDPSARNCSTAKKVPPVLRWFLGQADTKVAATVSPAWKLPKPTSLSRSPNCLPAQPRACQHCCRPVAGVQAAGRLRMLTA